jgi:lysophospholipase L1-like esterase
MWSRFTPAAVLFSAAACSAHPSANPAATPSERTDSGSVMLHESFLRRAADGPIEVLFVGDSLTWGWGGPGKTVWANGIANTWKAAHFGIGGDRTQHLLWRITDGKELENVEPKVVVLLIGTNNIGSEDQAGTNTPAETAEGVAAVVGAIRQLKPTAKVLLLGLFPRSMKAGNTIDLDVVSISAADLQPKVRQTNDRIALLDDGKSVFYLDIGSKFLDEQGGLTRATMPDFLHLSVTGYRIWAKEIEAKVNELQKE